MPYTHVIDPGASKTGALGWALLGPGCAYLASGLVRFKDTPSALEAVHKIWCMCPPIPNHAHVRVVVERMVHYPPTTSFTKPTTPQRQTAVANDLIRLSELAGAVAGQLAGESMDITYVTAREWKGQLPKDVVESRVRKTLSRDELFAAEVRASVYPAGIRHNMWDAIAIGLVEGKRMVMR